GYNGAGGGSAAGTAPGSTGYGTAGKATARSSAGTFGGAMRPAGAGGTAGTNRVTVSTQLDKAKQAGSGDASFQAGD
ncbi:hypothetical protein QP775_25715, partial [Paenibacillus sp. UMB4589-SE434]|nr:hypothetical protein [Paenibacillus sp. UMB4589-SE434]